MSVSQINSLISLIEDPDEGIFSHVRAELISCGEHALPLLEQYWEVHSFGELFHQRVEELIKHIQFQVVCDGLKAWKESPDQDLLEGVLIVNRFQYPTFDQEEIRRQMNRIRQDIWLELNDNLTALEIVRVFNHILFGVHEFTGNKQNYTAPQNSYLSDVLQSKKGNPLSLAIIYQIVANSLDIPIFGVNLPSHFVLAYLDSNAVPTGCEERKDFGVLFYINPFSEGTVIHPIEISEFLGHLDLPPKSDFYGPCTNAVIMQRMLNNLSYAYNQTGNTEKVEELKILQEILK